MRLTGDAMALGEEDGRRTMQVVRLRPSSELSVQFFPDADTSADDR